MSATWTPSATQAFERFLVQYRDRAGADVDADEVTADLRRHVEEELARAGLSVVTEADVLRLLARFDSGVGQPSGLEAKSVSSEPVVEEATPETTTVGERVKPGWWARSFWMMAGVVLPLVACVIEWAGNWCAEMFFDPLPTVGYGLIALFVPISNLVVWRWVVCGEGSLPPRWLRYVNALSAGVAAYFALMFLPLTPLAIPAIILFGLGLLPLAPAAGLLVALSMERRMSRMGLASEAPALRGWAWAFLIPLVTLLSLSVPAWYTRVLMHEAVQDSPEAIKAIQRLRSWGDREQLLKACYGNMRGPIDNAIGLQLTEPDARKLYFRVTGRPFNSVRPPLVTRSRRTLFGGAPIDEIGAEWDENIGGDQVSGVVRGLSLMGSRLDGLVGASEGTSYTEWTMEFRNDHPTLEREARAQIQLPPGGAVSRLTLWVNGEEREAAFAGRSQTREAYQKVAVVQRRDPVLVTTSGPDRVLMQCFPVPPRGGTMKVRVGITAPLVLSDKENASSPLSFFVEHNFKLPSTLEHSVWVEASQPLSAANPNLKADTSKPGRPALRGALKDVELSQATSRILVKRPSDIEHVWAEDSVVLPSTYVRQTIATTTLDAPPRVVLVLDDSASMSPHMAELARALQHVPDVLDFTIYIASDEVGVSRFPAKIAGMVRAEGGKDNVEALEHAWDWAAEKPGSVVLWVHGPQPELLRSAEGLVQRLERQTSPQAPTLYDLPVAVGPNRIAEKMDGKDQWMTVHRHGTLEHDLERLLAAWSGPRTEFRWARERMAAVSGSAELQGKKGSSHVIRLLALDEVRRALHNHQFADASKIAGRYQLVTPASGAVVLETQQQYQQSGLNPVDPATVPLVPEPEVVALLLLGLIAVGIRRVFGKRG